jgi:plastocyanin
MNRKFTIRGSFIFLGILFLSSTSFCTNHTVNVQSYSFTPGTVNASVGDTITWQWVNGSHTTTCNGTAPGTSLPPGAAAWDSPINSTTTTYSYVITVAGEYDYVCVFHYPTMPAGIIMASPLPVELVSFTGSVTGNIVNLNWQTASEKNNRGFEIQRRNGNNWEKIGFVQGHGTTPEKNLYSYKDNVTNIQQDELHYRLKQIDFSGTFEYSSELLISKLIPAEFNLSQNYPNPFNPSTQINYSIPTNSDVILKVYDAVGKEVTTLVNEEDAPGNYQVIFDASKFASGIYYYTINAGSFTQTRKMILMK